MGHLGGARVVAVLGVLLFWVGILGAGTLVDGYSARADYISSLAGRGSPVAALGIGAMLCSAVAHLAAARAVLHAWSSRVCASFLLGAAMATVVVAAFRSSCPDGPAGCALAEAPAGDWISAVHGAGVGAYELFTLAAMLTLSAGGLRGRTEWPRWLGWASMAMAVGSVLLLGQTDGDHLGLWQRIWVANNLAWLLVVACVATAPLPSVTHAGRCEDEVDGGGADDDTRHGEGTR